MRKLIILAVAAIAIGLPVGAFAGNGATTGTESWTDQSNNFGQDPCTGQLRTGIGSVAATASAVARRARARRRFVRFFPVIQRRSLDEVSQLKPGRLVPCATGL